MWAYDGLPPAELKDHPQGEVVEKAAAVQLHGGLQLDNGPRTVPRAGARFTTPRRIGGSFDYASFERRDYWAAHVTANTSEDPGELGTWGLGLARLSGQDERWGGSLELAWDGFNNEPWGAHARYQAGVLTDKRFYHDLSAHVGFVKGRLGVSAGWRAWLTPVRNSTGPELMLRVWL